MLRDGRGTWSCDDRDKRSVIVEVKGHVLVEFSVGRGNDKEMVEVKCHMLVEVNSHMR